MILSDSQIREYLKKEIITINPTPSDDCFQTTGVDLHLGSELIRISHLETGSRRLYDYTPVRPKEALQVHRYDTVLLNEKQPKFLLYPEEFVLASTLENISNKPPIACQIDGKSSWARLGVSVHITAGYFEPGWSGVATLEIYNHSNMIIELNYKDKICQAFYFLVHGNVLRPYGSRGLNSHYQFQTGATLARFT